MVGYRSSEAAGLKTNFDMCHFLLNAYGIMFCLKHLNAFEIAAIAGRPIAQVPDTEKMRLHVLIRVLWS